MVDYHPNQDDVKFIIAKRIREHADKWDWKKLSKNKAITMDIILETIDLPWNQKHVPLNPNITWDFIINHIEYGNWTINGWHWYTISKKHVTMDIVKSHPNFPWDFQVMSSSRNLSITIDDVLENIELPWEWVALSRHPNMTWEIIQNHSELPWFYNSVSLNPNITWDIIKQNPNVDWDRDRFIELNVNLTHAVLKNNPEISLFYEKHVNLAEYYLLDNNPNYVKSCPWYSEGIESSVWMLEHCYNWYTRIGVYFNPKLTWDFIRKNLRLRWDWKRLSVNHNITWDIVKNNPDRPWDYSELSLNQNITWEIVRDNPDKPWDYTKLSSNKNITWDIVEGSSQGSQGSQHAWNWERLSSNPSIFKLTDQDVCFISRVCYIQTRWRDALYNPKYAICRRRILREFNELGVI